MKELIFCFPFLKHIKIKEKNIRNFPKFLLKLEEEEIEFQHVEKRKNNCVYIKQSDNESMDDQQVRELTELLIRSVSSFKIKFPLDRN